MTLTKGDKVLQTELLWESSQEWKQKFKNKSKTNYYFWTRYVSARTLCQIYHRTLLEWWFNKNEVYYNRMILFFPSTVNFINVFAQTFFEQTSFLAAFLVTFQLDAKNLYEKRAQKNVDEIDTNSLEHKTYTHSFAYTYFLKIKTGRCSDTVFYGLLALTFKYYFQSGFGVGCRGAGWL